MKENRDEYPALSGNPRVMATMMRVMMRVCTVYAVCDLCAVCVMRTCW